MVFNFPAPKCLYDHTIGSFSCQSILCCGKKRDYYYDPLNTVEDLRKILEFHFKSPFEKWKFEERRRFPWKLLVQIICIVLVTLQVHTWTWLHIIINDCYGNNFVSTTLLSMHIMHCNCDSSICSLKPSFMSWTSWMKIPRHSPNYLWPTLWIAHVKMTLFPLQLLICTL